MPTCLCRAGLAGWVGFFLFFSFSFFSFFFLLDKKASLTSGWSSNTIILPPPFLYSLSMLNLGPLGVGIRLG
ncbi:hypothetical protein CLU79DRAFT_731020, partial [Phycomyces nitens]